ncbi:MAG: type IV pilus secretin PilQ [Candidatus Aminicenantes bacterium]|nr:type IV pilus secretin PilQ [Candidatus Aminicenantes bacterium]
MKRTLSYGLIASLCCAVLVSFAATKAESPVTINKIHVQPGLLATKLVVEADAALPVQRTFYAPGSPRTLVIDVARAKGAAAPVIPSGESQLIKNVQVEPFGEESLRFNVELAERVPYRIFASGGLTVVELTKIQRNAGRYLMDPDVRAQLDKAPRAALHLDKLEINQAADQVSFRARLDGEAIAQVFALENPSRLVVDLFDTTYGPRTSIYPVGRMGVEKVRVGQFQQSEPRAITRLVFDLVEPSYYALDSAANEVVVSFFSPEAASEALKPSPVAARPAETIRAAEPVATPKVEEAAPRVEVTRSEERRPLPATVVPPPPPPMPQESTPAVQAKPATSQDQFKPKIIKSDEEQYTGEIVSLKVKDADLRDVVLTLSEIANLNVVFDPDVRGIVTCNLEDVPWDQALEIVLRQNKMGKTIEGNVLRVAPINTLAREDEDQRKIKESKEMAGPLDVKTVTLSYSKAKDVANLLQAKKSSRGEIVIDDRTNTLIISEVRDKLNLLERLIAVLDTPTPQVSIEARIVEASATFIRNLGIQWGYRAQADPFFGNQTSLQFPNKALADGALIPQGIVTKGIAGPLGGYAVNLPAPSFNAAVGFSFANILDTFRVDLALTALETSGDGRIISAPKVSTQNNKQAEIVQGRQIPVQTVANFTVTTRYINAALELRATPQITAEGTIIMDIQIQNNAADFANLVNGIPPIITQSALTTVMIPDGGTTVIGGIYRTEDSITRNRIPFLYQIPILGTLFQSFARTKQTRELLIFITPRIIK